MFGIKYADDRIRPNYWDTLSPKKILNDYLHRVEGGSVAVPKDYINNWELRTNNY